MIELWVTTGPMEDVPYMVMVELEHKGLGSGEMNVGINVGAPGPDVCAGNREVNKKDTVEFDSRVVVGNTPKEVFNEVITSVDEVMKIDEDKRGDVRGVGVKLNEENIEAISEIVEDLGGGRKEVTIPLVVDKVVGSSNVVVIVVKVGGNIVEALMEIETSGVEIVEASEFESELCLEILAEVDDA